MSDFNHSGRNLPQVDYDQSAVPQQYAPQPSYDYGSYGYYGSMGNTSGKEQIHLIFDMLFRRKWMALAIVIVAIGGTAAYTFTRTPQYTTSAYVMLEAQSRVSGSTELGNESENAFAVLNRSVAGEVQLLKISDRLRRRVYARLEEEQDEGKNASLLRMVDSVRALQGGALLTATIQSSWVDFTPLAGSFNIIVIHGNSSVPEHSAVMANLYAEEYISMTREASTAYASSLRESLVEQERTWRNELAQVEQRIQTFINQEGLVGLDPMGAGIVSQVTTLEAQREQLLIELEMSETSLALIEQEIADLNPTLVSNVSSILTEEMNIVRTELQEEQATLRQIIKTNPEVEGRDIVTLRPLKGKISRLEAELDSLSQIYVSEAQSAGNVSSTVDGIAHLANLEAQERERRIDISGTKARIRVIDNTLSRHESELDALPAQSRQLAQLERDREQKQRRYAYVVDRLQTAQIQEDSDPGYASMLRRAYLPRSPYYPVPAKDLTLGAMFGLLLALGLALVLDKLDAKLYAPGQLKSRGYKEIGIIPDMTALIASDHEGKEFYEHKNLKFSTSLVSLISPISAISEAYRSVRTYLNYNLPNDQPRTILISSPGPGEGKSTTAANIAICMAQAGNKTLLVDADLRKPKQHSLFGLRREKGLRELLSNGNTYHPEQWTTFVDNLSVLTAARTTGQPKEASTSKALQLTSSGQLIISHPPELLGSEKMLDFLGAMKEKFDVIIIDSPPVLAATDASVLSNRCLATIVVARAGKTKGGELDHTMETFADVGAEPIGVILNDFDMSKSVGQKYRYQHYADYLGDTNYTT